MFPIRQEIEVLSADKVCPMGVHDQIIITSRNRIEARDCTKGIVLGWKVYETIGVAVVNARYLSKLTKKNSCNWRVIWQIYRECILGIGL